MGNWGCDNKWCQNSVQPDLQTLDRISKLLNVDIRGLLVGAKKTMNLEQD